MALTIFYVFDQLLTDKSLAGILIRKHLLQGIQNNMNDLDVLLLIMSADIVGLKESALFLYHVNSLGMILYIEPVPDILSISINRKILAMQSIVNDQRDQLLRELVRSVIVGAVCNICRELISIHIGFYQKIRRSLACRIGAMRIIRCCFIEKGLIIIRQRAVNLIC